MDDRPARHHREITKLVDVLDLFLLDDSEAHVGEGLTFYYEPGNPEASVVPDIYVARETTYAEARGHVKLWEKPTAPIFVLEIVTPATRDLDQGPKKDLYAQLGVDEYFLFDPNGDCLDPPFQGFRLDGSGDYRPLEPVDGGVLTSRLGVSFQVVGGQLRIVDLDTDQTLAGSDETLVELEKLRSDVMRMFE